MEAFRLREEKKAQYFDYTIFQNEPAGNMTVYGTIIPDRYSYTEDSKAMKWTLADDEKTLSAATSVTRPSVNMAEGSGRRGTARIFPCRMARGNCAGCRG